MYDSRLIWREPVLMPSVLCIGGFGELGESRYYYYYYYVGTDMDRIANIPLSHYCFITYTVGCSARFASVRNSHYNRSRFIVLWGWYILYSGNTTQPVIPGSTDI